MPDPYLLRSFRKSDLSFLYAMRNDPELQFLLLTHPRPNSMEQVKAWIERKVSSESSLIFMISGQDGRPAGFMQAADIDTISRFCRIGIAIAGDFRGKGVFKKIMPQFEKYLSDTLNIRKIIAEILESNEHSVRAFESAGYVRVGVLKEHYYNQGAYHDLVLYEKFI